MDEKTEQNIRNETRDWCGPIDTDRGCSENQAENIALHFFNKGRDTVGEELNKLMKIERHLELFRDDIKGYCSFIERNIKQGNELVFLEDKLKRIEEQATRRKRGTREQNILITDLEVIEDICGEKMIKEKQKNIEVEMMKKEKKEINKEINPQCPELPSKIDIAKANGYM